MTESRNIAGTTGDPIGCARDLTPLIQAAFEHRGRVLVLPADRLDPAFFQLRSGVACLNNFLKQFSRYEVRLGVRVTTAPWA